MGMAIAVLGVDLGKNVCSVVGLDASGAVVMRRKVRRETLIALAEKLPACVVGMEACCGAHHLGRLFAAHGHDVRLMSPEYVRPYVKAQKNDDRDAEGIAEAATRPTMRFVELKSQDQLDMQTLHRSRDRLVGERTALINQLRAILLERGMVAPQGKRKLEQFLSVLMDEQDGAGLSPRMVILVADVRAQWAELDRRIAAFDGEFVRWARENEDARRLVTIRGSARSSPLRSSRRLDGRRLLNELVIFRPGSASSLSSSPPAANRSCSGSASAATNISASS
jgi:transposase